MKSWFDVFPREQIHILSTEEMEKKPQETLIEIFKFLEIPEYTIINAHKQKSAKYENMNVETRKRLLDYYQPFNEEFFKIINQRFDWEI